MVRISSYEFGSITIDGRSYHEDVIICWDGEVEEIRTKERHIFGLPELQKIMEKKPELIIVGRGASGLCKISDKVREEVEEKNLEFIESVSREAMNKFNEAFRRGKKVSAFIHLTC